MDGRIVLDLVVLAVVIASPIAAYVRVRSLAWVVVAFTASVAVIGSGVSFLIDWGHPWTFVGLQWALIVAMLIPLGVAFFSRRRVNAGVRHQLLAIALPMGVLAAFIMISRLGARSEAGGMTAVGLFIKNVAGEDNAKWLDFTAQLVQGGDIIQGVPLGGPLQLLVVAVATALAVASQAILGGVNEVFVASNSVVYSEFGLIILAPLALAPLAEARFRLRQRDGDIKSRFLPTPFIWVSALVLATANTAATNFGHLTFQWVTLVVALWVIVWLVPGDMRHASLLTGVAVISSAIVWFPMMPVSLILGVALALWVAWRTIRATRWADVDWFGIALLIVIAAFMAKSTKSTLLYMTDQPSAMSSVVGGARGVIAAVRVPTLDLLTSQGGTEVTGPVIALLAGISAVVGGIFLIRQRWRDTSFRRFLRLSPLVLLVAYAMGLSLLGTWWAGVGPAYGGHKVTFMVSIVAIAATLPLALAYIGGSVTTMSLPSWIAIAAVVYLLAVDSLLPRAMTLLSPQRWPDSVTVETDFWWPAEVRAEADQPIIDSPIACAYFPQGSQGPTALPNGQTSYSCTRILAGLSGADSQAQPLVDWARREWLTNEAAWTAAWPDLVKMPDFVRQKQIIIMDEYNNVIGFETVQSMLDRYRPEWALGQDISTFTG